MIAYVGCRTTKARNARGEGIAVFDISADGKWTSKQTLFVEENPSYLCFDKERKYLYSVHGDITKASSYRILEDGTLEHINTIEIGGTVTGFSPISTAGALIMAAVGQNKVASERYPESKLFLQLFGVAFMAMAISVVLAILGVYRIFC